MSAHTDGWKLVAGAFLHFGVLAFVLLVPLATLLLAPTGADGPALARLSLRVSAWIVLALVTVGALATLSTRAAGRVAAVRRRALVGEDAVRSEQPLLEAVAAARAIRDRAIGARVARLAARAWDHRDPRAQALARDLAQLVRTAAPALAGAPVERQAALRERLSASLAHLEAALDELAGENAAVHEQDAEVTACYIEQRWAAPHFATKRD